jgi:fumarate reductase subunit D
MAKRSSEPLFWALFSSGGMLAALFMPVLAFAWPLEWLGAAPHAELVDLIDPPLVKLSLLALITLSVFHWAHRFRFTLYDGLQLSHLYGLIATVTYGGATLLTLLAAWLIWTFP